MTTGRRARPLRFIVPLGLLALLLAVLAAGLARRPMVQPPAPLVGRPAPDFALARLDGEGRLMRRDDLLGRAWVLHAWASWCAVCREEQPTLQAFARRHAVPLIGLDYKDAPQAARSWLARHGNPYHAVLADPEGRTGLDYGVRAVPETWLVDAHGRVRWRHAGPLTAEVIQVRIEPLLKVLEAEAEGRDAADGTTTAEDRAKPGRG